MRKKHAPGNDRSGALGITRRDVLAIGAVAATSLYLPSGLIRSARAQSSGVQYNQTVIGQLPDFYISPTGTGSASAGGTAANPWSIAMLNDATARSRYAGKVVGLMNGTYNLLQILGMPVAGGWWGTNRLMVVAGTASAPTIIVSQTPQGAVIYGARNEIHAANSSLDWGASLMGPDGGGAGITFDGIHFTASNYRSISNYGPDGTGVDNFTVRNCLFDDQSFITCQTPGKNSCHFYSEGKNHIYVQNSRFVGGGAPSDQNRHASIQFYAPTTDTLVEYCTVIADPQGAGNLVYWKEPGHMSPVCRYCFLDRSESATSYMGSTIMMDGQTTSRTASIDFHHNIMIAGSQHPNIWRSYGGNAGVWNIYNNTILGDWSSLGNMAEMYAGSPVQTNIHHNIFWPSKGGGNYADAAVYSTAALGTMDYNNYPSSVSFHAGDLSSGVTYTS